MFEHRKTISHFIFNELLKLYLMKEKMNKLFWKYIRLEEFINRKRKIYKLPCEIMDFY